MRPLNIAFLHPNLGMGGAERLVVDAASHLQTVGHRVTLFTTHHDRARCFAETRDGALRVRVYGGFLPSHIGQRLRAPCMIARMAYLVGAMTLRAGRFDVIFCDLISHTIPFLRVFSRARIVFYCHFPDQLLTPPRHFLYRLYRGPIDCLEELTTGMADRVLVNSHFTASVFRQTFLHLHTLTPEVLPPGVDCDRYVALAAVRTEADTLTILSINRYEPKKNVRLAIEALALLRERISTEVFRRVRLIVAGDYNERRPESRDTLRQLQRRAQQARLTDHVVFKRSVPEAEYLTLLSQCLCVVYTPEHEHFGIVPLEAMAAGRPVVAVNKGGPLETILHEETGLLCDPTPQAFAEAFGRLIMNQAEAERMGQAGRMHVAQHFSQAAFGSRLETILREVMRQPQGERAKEGRQ